MATTNQLHRCAILRLPGHKLSDHLRVGVGRRA